jgi:hypothetical protein
MTKKWIQKAIKRPGRTRKIILKLFGKKAFLNGIKIEYIKKAIKRIKRNKKMSKSQKRSLLSALNLALRLKKMIKKRKRR